MPAEIYYLCPGTGESFDVPGGTGLHELSVLHGHGFRATLVPSAPVLRGALQAAADQARAQLLYSAAAG